MGSWEPKQFPSTPKQHTKKASPKPNSQAKNPKDNPNTKQNPKHKQKNRLGTQKTLQQQPKEEKKRNEDSYPTDLFAATQFKTQSKQDVLEAVNFCLLKEPFFC